jgi:hypothetical protein
MRDRGLSLCVCVCLVVCSRAGSTPAEDVDARTNWAHARATHPHRPRVPSTLCLRLIRSAPFSPRCQQLLLRGGGAVEAAAVAEMPGAGGLKGDIFTRYNVRKGVRRYGDSSTADADDNIGEHSATEAGASAGEIEGPKEHGDFWEEERMQDDDREVSSAENMDAQKVDGATARTTWREIRERFPEDLKALTDQDDSASASSEPATLSEELHQDLSAAVASADVSLLEQMWLEYGGCLGADTILQGGGRGGRGGGGGSSSSSSSSSRARAQRAGDLDVGDSAATFVSNSSAVLFQKAVNKLRPVTPLMVP